MNLGSIHTFMGWCMARSFGFNIKNIDTFVRNYRCFWEHVCQQFNQADNMNRQTNKQVDDGEVKPACQSAYTCDNKTDESL